MCVIFLAETVRPTEAMIRLGHNKNSAGGGVAWREGGQVHYIKGLSLESVLKLNDALPFPYVIHLRNPSVNTATGKEGTHPFPVTEDSSYALQGSVNEGVLFHNGFWGGWREKILEFASRGGWELPDGPYSDSRSLAIVAAHMGRGALELINEKVIWFTPDAIHIFGPGRRDNVNGWVEVNDVLCSNDDWKPTQGGSRQVAGFLPGASTSTPTNTGAATAAEVSGGAPHGSSFRGEDGSALQAGGDQQKAAEEGNEEGVRKELGGTRALIFEQDVCSRCKSAVARLFQWSNTGGAVERVGHCWPCWDQMRAAENKPSGMAFVDRGAGLEAVKPRGICQFCHKNSTRNQTIPGKTLICQSCWILRDKPNNETVSDDDPRCSIGL